MTDETKFPNTLLGEVRIFDCTGREISHKEINFVGSENSISVSGSVLPKGIYIVQIRVKEQIVTTKLIVQ